MPFKFLIDECLSPSLVSAAHAAGHVESTCVRDRGLAGTKDWELTTVVVAQDFTLVTNNSKDFRGEGEETPGGLHAKEELHAGLVCLNCEAPGGMDLDLQKDLFDVALDELASREHLINQALGETVRIKFYDIPRF